MSSFETTTSATNELNTITGRTNAEALRSRSLALVDGRLELSFLIGITILALALRIFYVDSQGLWLDEIDSVQTAQRGIGAFFNDRFGLFANQTPWHYLLVWLTLLPTDPTTSTFFVRLPSILAGALLPLIAYGLGKDLFGRTQGVIAAVALVLAPTMLDYAQEVRPYIQVAFFTAAAVWCLLRAFRTGSARYWIFFGVAAIGIMLLSYTALTLVMPSIGLVLLWVLWKMLALDKKRLIIPLTVTAIIGLVGGLLFLDALSHLPRTAPSFGLFLPSLAITEGDEQLRWFTRTGIDENIEGALSLLLIGIAFIGAFAGIRKGGIARQGTVICLLLIGLPVLILAILSTSSPIYPRYLLFLAPFYFLLLANGIVALASLLGAAFSRKYDRQIQLTLSGLVLALFAFGAYNFYTLTAHINLTYRPDFPRAASYLSTHATADDTIIFINTPVHGLASADFYWHGNSPAPAYDAQNPLLFANPNKGRIYWVVAGIPREIMDAVSPGDKGWSESAEFERVLVLGEPAPAEGLLARMNDMVTKLHTRYPDFKPFTMLFGSILQAKGDAQAAADAYNAAGPFFPLGGEYLRTAIGFEARGNMDKAWQEAMMSKNDQPEQPDLHEWLAQRFQAEGYADQATIENQIAQLLSNAK